ncbi:leucine-rich_repeat domain-containing protein [Hexamita inflata]|uniref:Leucine-rich repeat domain-containing protein n=1 Tax=Hexamita inflata TaxID=28002 RepID=A0AA86NLG4_9EUKA|nr:leucine-rich repeat domain-containing protein [Hexamita inflata]
MIKFYQSFWKPRILQNFHTAGDFSAYAGCFAVSAHVHYEKGALVYYLFNSILHLFSLKIKYYSIYNQMLQHFCSQSVTMKQNHVIRSQQDLLKHFGSSQKLEICDLQQMKGYLQMNVQPEVWEDALNKNLLSFSQEFVLKTKKFTLNCREIENIYLISFLTNLTELNLSNNNISNISSISKLKNLRILDLNINSIEDISALQSLTNLIFLDLFNNKLTSYTLALPDLVELTLGYNKLEDKSGLQHSPKLEILNLNKTESTDLLTIPHQAFCQKVLNLQQISYLSNFVDLQQLYLSYNLQLQNIEPLKFCTQLTKLFIQETSVSDIWPLQFMKNLKTLQIAYTKVVDLHPLQYLYKLVEIDTYNACIIDVSPLAKQTLLDFVEFRFNKITNADTLKHHKNFSEYDFSDQEVPTPNELTFYSKILSVHSSHKKLRKIQAENRVSKFRESMTRQKEFINFKMNEQIQFMNKKIEIIFNNNSYVDQ